MLEFITHVSQQIVKTEESYEARDEDNDEDAGNKVGVVNAVMSLIVFVVAELGYSVQSEVHEGHAE